MAIKYRTRLITPVEIMNEEIFNEEIFNEEIFNEEIFNEEIFNEAKGGIVNEEKNKRGISDI